MRLRSQAPVEACVCRFAREISIGERDPVVGIESAETRKLGLVNGSFAVQEYLVQTQGHTLILMGRDAEEYGPITYEKTGYWPTTGDWRPTTSFFGVQLLS